MKSTLGEQSSQRVPLVRAPRARRATLIACVAAALIALWPLMLRQFGAGEAYRSLGLFSAVIIVAMGALGSKPSDIRGASLERSVALGAAVGVAMTLATYLSYAASVALFPALAGRVQALYGASHSNRFGAAVAWTALAVAAEELLWRGPLFDAFPHGRARILVIGLSLTSYAGVQIGTGSWILALTALLCGAIWTAERLLTRSIVAPLVSHAIWTLTVIHLYPVTSAELAQSPWPFMPSAPCRSHPGKVGNSISPTLVASKEASDEDSNPS